MASKRIEQQVEQNYVAIQTLIDNAKQIHEIPQVFTVAGSDRLLLQLDSTKESVHITWTQLLDLVSSAGVATTFAGLIDTPAGYSGQAAKKLVVNAGETGVEFVDDTSGGVTTFQALNDTPNSYSLQQGKNVKVNSATTALEFTPDYMDFACGDETSDLVVSPSVFKMVCNRDYKNVSHIHFSVTTAPTGTAIVLGLEKNGATVLSVQPEIEVGEFSTHTSAIQAVFINTNEDFDIGDEMNVWVEQIGSTIAGIGLKATIIYNNPLPI